MKRYYKVLILMSFVLILNLIWEFSHYFLYIDMSGILKKIHLICASLVDMIIIGLIFLFVSLKNNNIKWIEKPNIIDYFIIIILSLIISAFIELRALSTGRWAYTELMPTVFGIGLSPLIQLAIVSIISLKLNKFFK